MIMNAKICTLMVHNSTHNPEELLLNPEIFNEFIGVNDYIRISDANNKENILILKVSTMQSISSRLEISIIKSVAEANNLKPFSKVIIEKVSIEECSVDFVELSFKRQYLQRGNIYRLQNSMLYRPVHCNQTLQSNGVQAQIQEIRKNSSPINSGIISEDTKFVFRSRSARIIWLVQISAEMWEFDQNGNLYFEKFLSEFMSPLLDLWKTLSVSHTLTVIFFSRTFYLERITSTNHPELYSKKSLSQTTDGFQYQDSFKIVIENIADFDKVDKVTLIKKLRQEFWEFPTTMGWKIPINKTNPGVQVSGSYNSFTYDSTVQNIATNSASANLSNDPLRNRDSENAANSTKPCNWEVNYAVPSDAVHGNFLEAINTSLNILDKHYMDRDLLRTNNSIVMISAGAGIYKVKHNLSQITKQRMLDNAFGLDFISLARPTIKTVPLFLVECRSEGVNNFYEIPHWMRISYVDCYKEMSETYDSRLQGDESADQNTAEDVSGKDTLWAKSFMLQPACNLLTSIIENSGDLKKLAKLYAKALPLPLKELMTSNRDCNGTNNVFKKDSEHTNQNIKTLTSKEIQNIPRKKDIPIWGSMKYLHFEANDQNHTTSTNSIEFQSKRLLKSSKSIFLADDIFHLKNTLASKGFNYNFDSKSNNNFKTNFNDVLEDLPILRRDYSESVGSYGSTFGETIVVNNGSKEDHSPHSFENYHHQHYNHSYFNQPHPKIHPKAFISSSHNESHLHHIGDNITFDTISQNKTKTELLMETQIENLSERKRIIKELSHPEIEVDKNTIIDMMNSHDKFIFAKKIVIRSSALPSKTEENTSLLLKENVTSIENEKSNEKQSDTSAIPIINQSKSRDDKLRAMLVQSSNKSANTVFNSNSLIQSMNKNANATNIENSYKIDSLDTSNLKSTNKNEVLTSPNIKRNQKLTSKSFAKPVISQQQKQNFTKTTVSSVALKGGIGGGTNSSVSNSNQQFTFYHGKIVPIHAPTDNDAKLKSELYAKHIREYSQTHSVNPFRFKESVTYLNSLTHNRRRWAHVFPFGKSDRSVDYGLNWKSLTQPAILPLTTDYIPSIKSMDKGYDVNNFYQLLVDKSESPFLTSEDLMTEMICMRLTQEYQLIEGYDSEAYMQFINNHNNHSQMQPGGSRKNNAPNMLRRMDSLQFDSTNNDNPRDDSENNKEKQKNFFILSMGHRIQFLQFDDVGIKVTIYRSKEGLNLDDEKSMHSYSYETWIPQINAFMTSSQNFYKFPHTEFKWNKYDNIVVGNIPADLYTLQGIKAKHLQFTIIHPEILNEEKLNEYYTKFDLLIEFLNKYCIGSSEKFSIKKNKHILETGKYALNLRPNVIKEQTTNSSTRNNAFSPTNGNVSNRDENLASTFYPVTTSRLSIQDAKTSLLYHESSSINDYDVAKLIMRTSKQGNPNWLYCKYDKTVYSYKSYHLELYWMVCDAWLIDEFITLLYRRCQKWGIRLSQVPLYYHTENLSIHPYRTLPLISLPQSVSINSTTPLNNLSSSKQELSSQDQNSSIILNQMTSPLRMVERMIFSRSNGWVFDNEYKTDWISLNMNVPNYSERDRDYNIESICESIQSENQLTSSSSSSASYKNNSLPRTNPLSSLSKTFSQMVFPQRSEDALNIQVISSEKVNIINNVRQNKKVYDRQYIHCSGLAVCRVASNGFLWLQNSSSKISDININADEKREVVSRHKEIISEYCQSVVLCYELLCTEIVDKALNYIINYASIREIVEENIDEACHVSETAFDSKRDISQAAVESSDSNNIKKLNVIPESNIDDQDTILF